jgi:hypothetical protein
MGGTNHMRQIKKTLSIFMAALFVMAGFLGNVTAKAAVTVLPEVTFVGVEHSPLVVGDTETFTVSSKFEGLVQYRAFLYSEKTNKWTELTSGYTEAKDAKTVVELPKTEKFELGKYKLSVWVKQAGVTGKTFSKVYKDSYDSYYVASLNCVSRDNANRVYADGVMSVKQEGLKVTINSSDFAGLAGIEGPYKLKLNYFNPTTGTWTANATQYGDKIEYTFPKAGTYVLDVHVNTEKSTTWSKGYESWKLKVITVKESTLPTAKVEKALYNAALFSTYVQVSLNTTTPADYAVTINGVKATMFTDKNGNKLFDANIKGEVKLADVKVEVVSTVVVKPEVAKSKVEKALYNAALFSTYVQVSLDTTTPESYKVTINGVEAAMFTNKDGIKLFDANVKGEVKTADVKVVVTAK